MFFGNKLFCHFKMSAWSKRLMAILFLEREKKITSLKLE